MPRPGPTAKKTQHHLAPPHRSLDASTMAYRGREAIRRRCCALRCVYKLTCAPASGSAASQPTSRPAGRPPASLCRREGRGGWRL